MQAQSVSLVVDALGILAGAGGALAFLDARKRLKSAESRRNALTARLEDAERRLQERDGSAGKEAPPATKTTARASAARPAAPAPAQGEVPERRMAELEMQLSRVEAERDRGLQRIRQLEESLARREEERDRLQADFERRARQPVSAATTDDVADPRAPRPKSLQASGSGAAQKTPADILLASGDLAARAALASHLADAGYKVHTAGVVADVLEIARSVRPPLIALDIQLSKRGGDGFAALTALKRDPELREIPVVLICPVKDRERATELGAAGCVPSPATPNVLLGALNAALVAQKKRTERSRLAKSAKSAALSGAAE